MFLLLTLPSLPLFLSCPSQAWAAYAAEGFEVVLFPSSRKNPLGWLQGAWEHLADKRRRQRETLMKQEDKGEDG